MIAFATTGRVLSRLSVACAVVAMLVPGVAAADGASPQQVAEMLQRGGYVVYLRHTNTDNTTKDQDHKDLSSCATQRALSDEGRAEAKAIGEGAKRLGIKFGDIQASPYCRAMETAKLAFGKGEASNTLRYLTPLTKDEKEVANEALRKMLSVPPPAGVNTVLISHNSNLKEATGIWPKNAGVAHVFKPLGDGKFEEIGKIEANEWSTLVAGN